VAWDKVGRLKKSGGWGIKNLIAFGPSFTAKLGWRLLFKENLWTMVVKRKYLTLPLWRNGSKI